MKNWLGALIARTDFVPFVKWFIMESSLVVSNLVRGIIASSLFLSICLLYDIFTVSY